MEFFNKAKYFYLTHFETFLDMTGVTLYYVVFMSFL